ncbi:DUF4181 domain-containing protein [Virgibacillus sp. C22-A2]|uniref:DUF4181 domain-containing protein n=1 Tax=Virgibacillus tibetensis TaxID=3042313 RepID=A0ABU6KHQ9_9BACI|nr:DUF4181 domain-containing protein [Virgibacillus sp. C22-A2]
MNPWLWLLILVAIIYGFLSQRWLGKRFGIKRSERLVYQHVNKMHKIVERLLIIGILLVMFLFLFYFQGEDIGPLLATFFLTLFSVRAFIEWKFERTRKEYILTLNALAIFIFCSLVFFTFRFS